MALQLLNRTMDATRLNEVANHPDVRPCLGGVGPLDLSPILADPANVALANKHGGFVLVRQEVGIYEAHTMFLPESRGRAAIAAAEEGFRYLFTVTDCVEVQTQVPTSNAPAAGLASAVGFQPIFTRDNAWIGADGASEDIVYMSLTFDRWRARDNVIAAVGHDFHERLADAKSAAQSDLVTHPDDDAHDRAAGASMLMAQAGNARKAVWLYNRWARLAGYQSIELISETPAIIDVRDVVVEVKGESMEILLCR